jgi:aryl-alcohol dehydrogenase-like predicted oxidoreductase
MKTKSVSSVDLQFSAVGLGCWAAGGSKVWNGSDDTQMIRTIQRAVELGVNFFDVAPVYGFGHAETILGEALRGKREQVMIATKCGLRWDDAGHITNDLHPDTIRAEIDDSLRRLQTDYVDLYQLHWPDPQVPIAESIGALRELQQSGKIRHLGVSNFSLSMTDAMRQQIPLVSYQGLYNLLERNPTSYHSIPLEYRVESDVLPYCRQHGMAFFPYSPLFQGLLTNQFQAHGQFDQRDVRSANPKLNGEQFATFYQIREQLLAFAQTIEKPLSQVAINWLIQQEAVTSVICGAQTIEQIEENAASATWDLTPEMLAQIDTILQPYHAVIGLN